jgi:hypothetical protein
MLVAGSSFVVLLLLYVRLATSTSPRLDHRDRDRMRRYQEKVHREEVFPYE